MALAEPEGRAALQLEPIGVVRCPSIERADAPRQPSVAQDIEGTVELFGGRHLEDAVCDLEAWDYIWLIVWFDRNEGSFRPKVRPPRSGVKRGVLATRAPYRPNPIGISAVRLLSVQGLTLHVRGLDLLDGTPVLDVKPYVAYTDAIVDAKGGWLSAPDDPRASYTVTFSSHAEAQLAFLRAHGLELEARLSQALALGPSPHAYRRIKREGEGFVIAIKDFRARFTVEGQRVLVSSLFSGYKPRALIEASGDVPELHRAFVATYGLAGA